MNCIIPQRFAASVDAEQGVYPTVPDSGTRSDEAVLFQDDGVGTDGLCRVDASSTAPTVA